MRRVISNKTVVEVPEHYFANKNVLELTIDNSGHYDLNDYPKLEKLCIGRGISFGVLNATIIPREIGLISIDVIIDKSFIEKNKLLIEMAQIVQTHTKVPNKYRTDHGHYKYSLQNCKYFPKSDNYMLFLKCLMVKKIIVPKYIKFEILVMVIKQK